MSFSFFFFLNPTPTTEIYTLSYTTLFRSKPEFVNLQVLELDGTIPAYQSFTSAQRLSLLHAAVLFNSGDRAGAVRELEDRKSTRLNSSHMSISYAVFCLKKKTRRTTIYPG